MQKHNDLAKKKAWSDGLLQRVEEKKEKKAKAKSKSKKPSKKAKAKPKAASKEKAAKTRKRKAPTPDGTASDIHEDQPEADIPEAGEHALAPTDEHHSDALDEGELQVPSLFGNGFEPGDDAGPANQGALDIEEDKPLPMEVDKAEEQPLADDGENKAELLRMKKEPLQEQEVVAKGQGPPPASSSVPRKKVYNSPSEVLSLLEPPGFKLTMNKNEWRWTLVCF